MSIPAGQPRRPLVLVLVISLLAALTPLARAADPEPTSLRMFAASPEVTLFRYGKRVSVDLGLWLTPVGGDFEVRLRRPDYDSPMSAVQVDSATGETTRTIPAELLDGWFGFVNAFQVSFRDASGTEVARTEMSYCPNSWERERLSDAGRVSPIYPQFCSSYAPFVKGMVWGIDNHWAARVAEGSFGGFEGSSAARVKLPDGDYQVTAEMSETFADLFGVAPADARVELSVTVEEGDRDRCCFHRVGDREEAARSTNVPTVTNPDMDTRPDLVAVPAWNISAYTGRKGRDLLGFAATPWNAGPAPLWVEGFRRSGEETMDAYQYFTDDNGDPVGRIEAGTMAFDTRKGHNHWHFDQFARYTLLDSAGQEVVRSRKQSFCLAPTDAIDLTVPRADWRGYRDGFGTQCGYTGSLWVREVLPAGWGDTYYQYVAGQAFNITDVPNGWYTLRAEVDPFDLLLQSDDGNDSETRLLYLGGRPGARRVKVAPWHGMNI